MVEKLELLFSGQEICSKATPHTRVLHHSIPLQNLRLASLGKRGCLALEALASFQLKVAPFPILILRNVRACNDGCSRQALHGRSHVFSDFGLFDGDVWILDA